VQTKKRQHIPRDAAGLESLHNRLYAPYIIAYGRLAQQEFFIQSALDGSDPTAEDSLLSNEELTKLVEEHHSFRDELVEIRAAYKKAGGKKVLPPLDLQANGSSPSD